MARPEVKSPAAAGKKRKTDGSLDLSHPAVSNRKPRARPSAPPACFSVATFCSAHFISESFFYKLRNAGLGPREMQVGGRILITFESAAAWRAAREAAASTAAE